MKQSRPTICSIKVTGYKSLRNIKLELTQLNIMIGSNGAGKSNLVSLFDFLSESLSDNLGEYVGRNGGANSILFNGTKTTDEIHVQATLSTATGVGTLHQKCAFKPPDSLYYSDNHSCTSMESDRSNELVFDGLCCVIEENGEEHPGTLIYQSLKDQTFRLHLLDTSLNSPIRTDCYIEDNNRLRSDGGNLAAILYRYKKNDSHIYQRIRSTIRMVTQDFDDFVLEPKQLNPTNILLNWKQKGSDYLLGPHQISDGSLRAMVLITLLLQNKSDLPYMIIVDEPELGLHPYALNVIASLFQTASQHTQILISTQSSSFLDNFAPDDIIVVEREGEASLFSRPDVDKLKTWLEEYSLGEIWEKNVIGGGPH